MYFSEAKGEKGNLSYLKPVPYWHRPGGVFIEVFNKIKQSGVSNPTQLSNEYMELYTASLFGMGFEIDQKVRCWLTKPQSDPPDFALMTLSGEESGKIYLNSREIEITRYRGDKELFNTIAIKDKKAYPPDYVLLCFFEATGNVNTKNLSQSLCREMNNIGHVFLVGHGIITDRAPLASEIGKKVSIIQLVPEYSVVTFDLDKYFEGIQGDNKKLVHVEGRDVRWGLRDGDSKYPNLIN